MCQYSNVILPQRNSPSPFTQHFLEPSLSDVLSITQDWGIYVKQISFDTCKRKKPIIFNKVGKKVHKKSKNHSSHISTRRQYHQIYMCVFITSDIITVRPFICLSWRYSESTNTICFSSPSSSLFFFHFSPSSAINAFISRLPLVLQRHSTGTQLSLQPSKSSYTPPSALHLIFFTLSFLSIPLELCTITFLYKFLKSSTSISRSPP